MREIIQVLESFWNIELPVSSVKATKNKSEFRTLLQKIDFKFVCCLIIWYDVLSQIEITSKSLQDVNLNIPRAVSLISNTLEYVKDYRTDEQLQKMLETARKLSVELDIEPEFEKKAWSYQNKNVCL